MAKRKDEFDDTPTPEEIAMAKAVVAVPNAGFASFKAGLGKVVKSKTCRLPAHGSANAIMAIFKGKGGPPHAESVLNWNKIDAHEDGYIQFTSNRGRDVAALVRRLGDDGIHSFELPSDPQDYATINIKLDRFRSVAHAFRAGKSEVDFDHDREISRGADVLKALRNLPGVPLEPLKTGRSRWQEYQRPKPGTAAQLVEIYKGKGGGPESESVVLWSKWQDDVVQFTSDRGRDIAAVVKRLGDDGIHSFKVPDKPDWPIFINAKADRFRTVAHAFKAAKRDADEDDDSDE